MGYHVSSMIGIHTGGEFRENTDMPDFIKCVCKVAKEMKDTDSPVGFNPEDLTHCISKNLTADKGSFVVIAGVFNFWTYESVSKFARRLSKEFGTEVMVMTWDVEIDEVQCNIFLDGKRLFKVQKNYKN